VSAPAWTRSSGTRTALAALALAIGVTGWALVNAIRADALPDVPVATPVGLASISRGVVAPPADVQAAVENDLFSLDRSAPSGRYRMPGEHAADDKPDAEPTKPLVLGTVVATDGRSFATVQLGDARPTLVHVGDRIGEWTVRAIARGKITIVSPGGNRVDVTVPKPGI
jgi:hypothetical protein